MSTESVSGPESVTAREASEGEPVLCPVPRGGGAPHVLTTVLAITELAATPSGKDSQ